MLNTRNTNKTKRCAICEHFHEFEMPEYIIEELYNKRLIIFAGAGISTENKSIFPYTLYDEIKGELRITPGARISFSMLMSNFCSRPNGKAQLIKKIQDRLNYINSFPELNRFATRFHAELATIYFINTIITTNWDNYFESKCGATPFVTDQDLALFNIPGRKVFKIHGSISNYGSIIATAEDYKKCQKNLRDGILGSTLKHILGTKTVIYVGYSFTDEDFKQIHHLLKKGMGSLFPTAYIVTLDRDSDVRFRKNGLIPIYTDATYFLSVIKKHMVADNRILDDTRLEGILVALHNVRLEHERLHRSISSVKCPDIIYASHYQDGLIHAFERMLNMSNTGEYSDMGQVNHYIQSYMQIRKDKFKSKQYNDVAYTDGYINGLAYLLASDKDRMTLPYYYVFGLKNQPRFLADYKKLRKNAAQYHKAASKFAQRLVKDNIGDNPNLVYHHKPFLF